MALVTTIGMRFLQVCVVCSIKESSRPQNQQVQKVMSERSAGSCTRCTRANALPTLNICEFHGLMCSLAAQRSSQQSKCFVVCSNAATSSGARQYAAERAAPND